MSYFTKIGYSDTGSLDAFSRLRTSQPETLFSVQSQYDTSPIEMEGGATGTGVAPVWSSSTRMVALSVSAGTGVSFYQSYQYTPYQPGKSQFIGITGVLGTGVAGQVVDYGYGDAANGIFYRQNGNSGLQVVQRSSTSGSVVNTVVNQSSWSLDKLDGTGVSGITLDVTKAFILIIDLQFLGMGRVRLGFDIDGIIYYVHEFLNSNILTVPYMQSATLPISVTITGTAAGSSKTCYFKCATVQSEGGKIDDFGYTFSTAQSTVTAGNATRTSLISIRPKTTFSGVPNRSLFILNGINIAVTGANPIYWELCTGVTFSVAPTFADVNASSSFEASTGGTYSSLASGIVVQSGYVGASNQVTGAVGIAGALHNPIALNRAGAVTAQGTLTLLVQGLSATSACRASFNFTEIR